MTCNNSTLTQERLKEVLDYNPDTGVFCWRIGMNRNKAHAGSIAGWINDSGYRLIAINNITYRAHRLAWFYVYGKWPDNQIDHESGIRDDNRISKLNDVTNAENGKNQRIPKRNTSGICGVWFDKSRKKWVAEIIVHYKKIHLGRFEIIEDAANARKIAEKKYGFHQNHGRPL